MKKDLIILLAATIGTTVLTGCSSLNSGYGGEATGPVSALAFSPVTSPEQLVKWAQDFPTLRSIETYTFIVPVSVSQPTENLPAFSENLPPGSVFVEAAGGESKTYRVIRHSPNTR